MTHFYGLDIGSTNIKAAVLDLDRGVVEHVCSRPFPAPIAGLPPSHFEVDPAAIIKTVQELIVKLQSATPDVNGIVVCSQMGGVLLVDSQGQPLTNYLSWRDQRVLDIGPVANTTVFGELKCFTDGSVLAELGNELRPGSASSLLFWHQARGKLPPGACSALSLGDYVVASLTQSAPRTHATLALGTLNLAAGSVHQGWFQRIGIGHVSWPKLVFDLQPVGTVSLAGRDVPCYPAVGDQQAALLGAELEEGELSINISTGSQVSLLSRTPERGEFQTRPYFENCYLKTITHLPAGRSLNALVDLLTELPRSAGLRAPDPWPVIAEAVSRVASTDLKVDLAFFEGPMGDRGQIRNIRLENLTLGHVFRAAFEHMAENYLLCAARLSPARQWNRLVLSGGLPQRVPVLRDIVTTRFDCPARVVDATEETLQGLLALARKFESSQ